MEGLCREILFDEKCRFRKVVGMEIRNSRRLMDLDTVFRMIDYDKFRM
ncbi:arginine deiminase family protein, partial [Staphylococcus pasteuri]